MNSTRLSKVIGGDPKLSMAAAVTSERVRFDRRRRRIGVRSWPREQTKCATRYGRTKFGQSCLAARRLIENGSKFVTINHGGWDTHKDHFASMRRKLPELDRGLGTLIADLDDRGLLDSTIVWCIGEFGRTPKVATESPWNGGRHHFGAVFSTLVAGGGFKGGQVVGESDARGETVKDRPVYPGDLIGTMYELLGIDPEASLPHPMGEFVRATPGEDEGMESGGRSERDHVKLTETNSRLLKLELRKKRLPIICRDRCVHGRHLATAATQRRPWPSVVRQDPHLAYAYPAGCERGMTCEIVVGGQNLKDVDEIYLSGDGVKVEIVKWYRPMTSGRVQQLAE